jgi:hypothetical protein
VPPPRIIDGFQRTAVTFTTDDGECTVQDFNAGTCCLWRGSYFVRVYSSGTLPRDRCGSGISFLIAESDFIEPGKL